MDVSIDQARQQEAAAHVQGVGVAVGGAEGFVIAARRDAAAANQQAAIFLMDERALVGERITRRVEEGRAQQFAPGWRTHWRAAPVASMALASWGARARRTAKKTRSGVAGLASATGRFSPGAPNAAIASRMASRTEIASINGGSPTALHPITTEGSAARSRKFTSKISGTSDHDGSL